LSSITSEKNPQTLGTEPSLVESTYPAVPFLPLPSPNQQPTHPAAWAAHNPALAQYHQYVWQQNTKSASSEDAFKSIMQHLQGAPIPPIPQAQRQPPLLSETLGPDIILPPAQFNMSQPPPTLLPPPRKEVLIAPQPSIYSRNPSSHSDVSAGILFVHSDLGQNPQWRDQFASQFYRAPSTVNGMQSRTHLPPLKPRPLAPATTPAPPVPRNSVPLTRPEYLPPNFQNPR
jgi:hypothetical protein